MFCLCTLGRQRSPGLAAAIVRNEAGDQSKSEASKNLSLGFIVWLLFPLLEFRRGMFNLIHEPRLVGIAQRAFTVWQNPFGMLSPEVVMNLLPEIRDCLGYFHNPPFEFSNKKFVFCGSVVLKQSG